MNLWLANFLAYWLQVAVISVAAALAARACRLGSPRAALLSWQALLGLFLLLPVFEPWTAEPGGMTAISIAAAAAARVPSARPGHLSLLPLGGALLAAGMAARLIWLAMGYARLCRWRREARCLDAHQSVIAPFRVAAGVTLDMYLSSRIAAPVTFGLWHPTVLLPVRWLALKPGLQSAIVCHECLHVRRKDWGFHVAEEIIRATLWFHPAVWWLIAEIRLAREQVVDRTVIRLTGTRRPYVEALLAFAGVPSDSVVAAAAFSHRHHLARRISSIFEEVAMKKSRLVLSLAAITLCLVAAGALAIRTFPLYVQQQRAHRVSESGVVAPRVLYKVDPKYTQDARDAKIQGTVVMSVEVHPDGKAHNLKIERALDPGLDQNALDAVSAWRFQPGTKDGRPVPVKASIEINFRLL
ncbi:MAG TPA: M56 family metallopeptidase [Bryobacteraceae bacterium]|nr:M56 family metallopeptidase [Bryobacteraceae bacterium]